MKANFTQDLAKKYVYYLTFLLNPEERKNSTILTKVKKYGEFNGIFDKLPTKLKKGQEFVYNVFKCDDIRVSDLKDLLEDHFKDAIRDFFELLNSRDLEIGDLFLHDNYWLASPDCVGKECYDHAIDNLNSGKYLCKVYEECNNHECLKYLKIDVRNTIKAKMAKKRIDLYKGITNTNDDVKSFLNMFKNSKECATLDEEQQNVVLQQFNDMLSSNDTVEQIVEDVFYKDGKNYNSECYENSDSDDDTEDNMDEFSKSFKQTKKKFKEMKGGKKRTNYSHFTHHDYDETHIRKIEREIIEGLKDINDLGLTTKNILNSFTTDWRDEVFRGGKKQMGGVPPIDDIKTVAIIKKCVFVKPGIFSDVTDCNRYEVVLVDIENIDKLEKYVDENDLGPMDYRPIDKAISNISKMKSINGNYFDYWKVYTQQENGKEGEVVRKIDLVIKAKINEDSRFSNMDNREVYDKIIKNSKHVEPWFTGAKTQFNYGAENKVNPFTANSIEYKSEDDTTQPNNGDNPSSKSKDIQFIILERICTGVLYSTCKWSIILENETDIDKLIKTYTPLYGKNWKFYTRSETTEANAIIDAAVKTKIFNYYNPDTAKPTEQPATANANPPEQPATANANPPEQPATANANPPVANPPVANPTNQPATAVSDKEIADIANRLIEQGKTKEKEICGDSTYSLVKNCTIPTIKKDEIDLTEQKNVCDSVGDFLGTSEAGKTAAAQLKKACEFKSKAQNAFRQEVENAIQLKMPETNTFAEWIWYGTIYYIHKYVHDNLEQHIKVDDATRDKLTKTLSTRGKDTDNWKDYGKAVLDRAGRMVSKSNLFMKEGREASWARARLITADTAPWLGTFLLLLVKNPKLLRIVLTILVKIKNKLCNNLKIASGNITIIAKPKTLAEELDDLLKSINVWALSYVPPAFEYIEVGVSLFRAISLGLNSISKFITLGFADFESWIIWIFGLIILTSKDMGKEMVQSMILYDNLKSIIQLFDFIGCLNTPYCLNISPTRYDMFIELFDPNASYDYTDTGFFKKGNGAESLFSSQNWLPVIYNSKLKVNYVLNAADKEDYRKKLLNQVSESKDFKSVNGDIGSDMGKIKSKCFWCTNKKGEFRYYLLVKEVFKKDETSNNYDVKVNKTDKNIETMVHLGFKGNTFDVDDVNISYYAGSMAASNDNKYTLNILKDDDANDKNLEYIEFGFDKDAKINNLNAFVKHPAIPGRFWGNIKEEEIVKCELDTEFPILIGQDTIPASVNNFERLIMELAGTNPITCPDGKPSLKKEQVKTGGLKKPLGWYNNADKKLFQNKYKYTLSIDKDSKKIVITLLKHHIWGDMFTSAYQLYRVVSTLKNSIGSIYNYGKDTSTTVMSFLQDKLGNEKSVFTNTLNNESGDLLTPSQEELDKYQFKKSDATIADKPMCEEYFLVLHLGEAVNKLIADEMYKQMKFEIVKVQTHIQDMDFYDNEFRDTTYAAIAFKTKSISDSKFEVTETYYIPARDYMIHAIKSESSDSNFFLNALTKVIENEAKQENKMNPDIECDLYAIFDFLHYDMHGEIGQKYKITDHEYKHPDDIEQPLNALNTLFDNLIIAEQSNKTYSKKYFPGFSVQQSIKKVENYKKFFHDSNWGRYFQRLVLPYLVKEEKSISKHITDSLKKNAASSNHVDSSKDEEIVKSFLLWEKFTDDQIKNMSPHDVNELFNKIFDLWVRKTVYSHMLIIYVDIGDWWGEDKSKSMHIVNQYVISPKGTPTVTTSKIPTVIPNIPTKKPTGNITNNSTATPTSPVAPSYSILNTEEGDLATKDTIPKRDQIWKGLYDHLSQIDAYTFILTPYEYNEDNEDTLGWIDPLNVIMNTKLTTMNDVILDLKTQKKMTTRFLTFLTRICGIHDDLKEKKSILIQYNDVFLNTVKTIDKAMDAAPPRVVNYNQAPTVSFTPVKAGAGNKAKLTKRNYGNIPHQKSNKYTRRSLYQDTRYNTYQK